MPLAIERITTVLNAAVSYDLTDLTTAKLELSLKTTDTSKDAWLQQIAIPQVSGDVQDYVGRPLVPEQLQDVIQFGRDPFPGDRFAGLDAVSLSRWPVLSVISVSQSQPDGNVRTLVEGTDFSVKRETGQLLRLTAAGLMQRWEAYPLTVIYTAGCGALQTEAHTVPASPYQVTVDEADLFSCDSQVTYAGGVALARVAGAPAQGQYAVADGLYTFAAADAGQALTFAYATVAVPPGLVKNVLRLITERFQSLGRDPNLMSEETPGVGTRRWWVGGSSGQSGQFAPDLEAALNKYRVPSVY